MVQGDGYGSQNATSSWASLDQSEAKRAGFDSLQKKCQADQQRKISTASLSAPPSWMGSKKAWGSRDVDQFKRIHNY